MSLQVSTNLESNDQQNCLNSSHVGQQSVDLTAETDQGAVYKHRDKSHYFHNVLRSTKK